MNSNNIDEHYNIYLKKNIMSLQLVIGMNNHVVSLLESQRYHEAIPIALSAMQELEALSVFSRDHPPNTQSHNTHRHPAIDLYMRMGDSHEVYSYDPDVHHAFLYQHGIILPPTTTDMTTITLILIFNGALSYHLLSIEFSEIEPSVSQELLLRARGLYGLVFRDHCRCCNPSFRVAMMNNIGVICRDIDNGDQEDGENLFGYLESFVLYLLITGS